MKLKFKKVFPGSFFFLSKTFSKLKNIIFVGGGCTSLIVQFLGRETKIRIRIKYVIKIKIYV